MQTQQPSAPLPANGEPGEPEPIPPNREVESKEPERSIYAELIEMAALQQMERDREQKRQQIQRNVIQASEIPVIWYEDTTIADMHYVKIMRIKKDLQCKIAALLPYTSYNNIFVRYYIILAVAIAVSIGLQLYCLILGNNDALKLATINGLCVLSIVAIAQIANMYIRHQRTKKGLTSLHSLNNFYRVAGYNLQFLIGLE
jgi:hypothetical protein